MILRVLGEDGRLVVAIGDSNADRGGARAGGSPCIHGDHHKLIDVIGSLIVKATGGAYHTPRCDVKVATVNEVRQLRVHTGVTIPGQN